MRYLLVATLLGLLAVASYSYAQPCGPNGCGIQINGYGMGQYSYPQQYQYYSYPIQQYQYSYPTMHYSYPQMRVSEYSYPTYQFNGSVQLNGCNGGNGMFARWRNR